MTPLRKNVLTWCISIYVYHVIGLKQTRYSEGGKKIRGCRSLLVVYWEELGIPSTDHIECRLFFFPAISGCVKWLYSTQ